MDTVESSFQIKSIDDGGLIEGLAAAYSNVDYGGDVILPGAMAKALAELAGRPMPMLRDHDHKKPIGVWTELRETSEGLLAKGKLTMAVRDAQEAYALARDSALTGLSIGYLVEKHSYAGKVRKLEAITPKEASLVSIPMNDRARVHRVKSITSPSDIEELFREEYGWSGRKAKAGASAAWKAFSSNEDEAADVDEIARLFEQHSARLAAIGGR